jgi:hypothetical protein
MSGFELVDTPAEDITPAAAQQPVEDLAGLLERENEPQKEITGEPSGPALEVEQLGAESVRVQEQPLVEDSEQDEETYTIKVNGAERKVTLNDLKEGFQLKSDYTRSKQELADREQQLGLRSQGVDQQEEQYGQLLGAMHQRLESMIPAEPDWARLAAADPIEHTRQRAAWDQLQTQMKSVEQEQERVVTSRQQKFQHNYQGYMQDQQRRLLNVMPELSEPGKAQEFFSNLNQYAVNEYGFTPQEVASISDHRFALLADKARKWDLLQTGARGKEVVVQHIPNLKPGAHQKQEPVASKLFRKANARLERTGDTRDAADAIEALL